MDLSKDEILEQSNQILNEQKDINKSIQNEIILSIIKKSQYRTLKMRQELLPNKFNSKNADYKKDDFIFIDYQGFNLYYNSKDQILNDYTYKVDSYSIGMIIHFILNFRIKIQFQFT